MTQRFSLKDNPPLYYTVLANLTLALVDAILLAFDPRLVTGITPWYKPLKFSLSAAIYAATMAWILRYLEQTFAKKVSRRTAICLAGDIFLITLQAARGVGSHYNLDGWLNQTIFVFIGLFIIYNMYLAFEVWLEFLNPLPLPANYLKGIRYGLSANLLGNLAGIYAALHMSHTVGAPDGGPGLPLLNWSLEHGDVRIAHFIGVHGFQFFIALGALLTYGRLRLSEKKGANLLALSFFAFYLVLGIIFLKTLSGKPILAMTSTQRMQ